LPKSGVPVM